MQRTLENEAEARELVSLGADIYPPTRIDQRTGKNFCDMLNMARESELDKYFDKKLERFVEHCQELETIYVGKLRWGAFMFPATPDPDFVFFCTASAPNGLRLFGAVDSKHQRVLDILRAGMIDRLRRCSNCPNWFFAMRTGQRYCSKKCRRHAYQTTPEFQIANAEYQKARYWDGIEKSERLKQIARGERPTFRVVDRFGA